MKKLPAGVWGLAAAKLALHLATVRFGYHRDELYFVAASKRLSASYVDFQPVTPLLVRAVRAVFGDSLYGIRLIPALAGVAMVVLAALIARELGGGRRAQLFAAFAALVVPFFIGMQTLLATISLEVPAWALVALVTIRLLRTEDPRLWPLLGAAIGLALLVKFTALAYVLGLAVGLLLSPVVRSHLRTPWPWLGAFVAVALLAPSLLWQAMNSWPVLEFVANQGTGGRVFGLDGRAGYLASLALLPGPVALWLWVPGARYLLRDPMWRTLGVATVGALVVFLAASGKGYYAMPGVLVLIVAGAVAADARPGWSPRVLTVALVANLLIPIVIVLPVVPISTLRASPDLAQATELSERFGWEDLARIVAGVADSLPPEERDRAIVMGSNYALAAAVEFYAERFDLPPAGSGHNSAYLWPPDATDDRVVIAIGLPETDLRERYRDVRRVATVTNREGIRNYEYGKAVYVARGPRLDWDEEWRRLKLFTA